MAECQNCEYHKDRAARWRAEAYKRAGHDVIELPWVGLTDEQMQDVVREAHIAFCLDKFPTFEEALIRKTEAAHGIKGDA